MSDEIKGNFGEIFINIRFLQGRIMSLEEDFGKQLKNLRELKYQLELFNTQLRALYDDNTK